jgi:hypothetical protein
LIKRGKKKGERGKKKGERGKKEERKRGMGEGEMLVKPVVLLILLAVVAVLCVVFNVFYDYSPAIAWCFFLVACLCSYVICVKDILGIREVKRLFAESFAPNKEKV